MTEQRSTDQRDTPEPVGARRRPGRPRAGGARCRGRNARRTCGTSRGPRGPDGVAGRHPGRLHAHRGRGDRRHDLPARARALRDGPPRRDVGHRVLHRIRPEDLVVPPRRDRVRHQGHPGRRLRADHRHVEHGGGRPGPRGPHVPPEVVLAASRRGRRRLDDALPHRHRVVVRPVRVHRRSRRRALGRRRRHPGERRRRRGDP